jgi:hypothetical protein
MNMPLIKSDSDEARSENIGEMIKAGYPPKQAKAAAYANQREAQRHTHQERQAPLHEQEKYKYGK